MALLLGVLFALDAFGALPSSYDLRTLGYVTPVKNQNPYGTCWAFGSLGALESALKMKEGVVFDLSENHMINMLRGNYFAFERKGNPDDALAYLVSWSGPTLEAIDAYPNPNNSRSRYPIRHVQNVFCINPRTSYLDNDGIKNALVELGALAVGYYHDDNYYNVSSASYYNNDSVLASSHTMDYRDSKWHCVTLVGWDDNYSRNNFSRIPAGNGAFIVKNSWGPEWGDNGYFYVSYYDNSFAWGNYLYSFAGVEETDNYDSIYQYDYLGMTSSFGGSSTTGWGAAMFVADEDAKISAAGFYALEPNTSYTAYVYTDCSSGKPRSGKLVHSQSGKLEYPGFHTVPFNVESPVNKSQRFSIVLKITTPNNKYPIVYSDPDTAHYSVPVPVAGQTFYSSSGSTWTDFTKSSSSCFSSGQCCFCCKAYTRRTSSAKKLSSIAISGRSTVGGGASAQFSCSATYSDGSTLSVTPTWTISEGAEYASISSGGIVTGRMANDSHAVTAMACYSEGSVTKTAVYKFTITASEYVTITFDPNGGDMGGVSTSQKVVKRAAVGTLPMPTRKGCSFAGWWIPGTIGGYDSFGMPTIGIPDEQVLASTIFYYDTKVIAYWTFKTYAVTLDQQGGSGGTASVTATYDSPMPTITVPKRAGYTFAGYWTEVDGEGTQYYTASGAGTCDWKEIAPTTLYAHWTDAALTSAVTFGKNGGTGGSDSVQATKGQAMPAATAPTKDGYVFDGYWDTTKEVGKQYYDASMKSVRNWDKTGNVTLWAKWVKPVACKVTFGKNGGTGGDDYVTATTGQPMPTPRTAPKLSGWTFAGYWDTLALDEKGNAKGKQYYDASMKSVRAWDKTSATTLWAKWTNKVTLGKNGGTGGDSYVTCTKGQPMPKRTMPTKAGYVFDGYWTTTGAGGVKYYNADGTSAHVWNRKGDTTLWAKWVKPVACKVTFGKNGGTGGDNYVTATTGKPMPAPRTAPTLKGWTFGGYWDTLACDASGNPLGKQYYDSNMKSVRNWDKTTAATLWAKWTVRVKLGKNGGTGGDSYVTVTKDQSFPKRTMPKLAGYAFSGYWISASSITGRCYNADGTGTSSMKWTTGGTPIIWALWTKALACVELPAPVARRAATVATTAAPASLTAGLYSGVLADGSGAFWLVLDEPEEGNARAAFLYVASEDGSYTVECEVQDAGGVLLLTTEDGAIYVVDPATFLYIEQFVAE